jgi:hypothetical protein
MEAISLYRAGKCLGHGQARVRHEAVQCFEQLKIACFGKNLNLLHEKSIH